ncbi:MAG: GTP-binding protein [Ruthenibacterium sp.]
MTKITIFSGFLGAGKTTLIKKLIADGYAGEKLVLIENEFGEIGIDGGFLKDAGIEVTEMNSGCICCSLVGDFGKALQKVLDTYHPDRILIEPSGVGKLSDVIAAVQALHADVTLAGFVTVADARKAKPYLKNFGEFYNNQIENASAIILSRTDGISAEKLAECVALLRAKNATAPIVTTPWENLSGAQIIEAMEQKDSLAAALAEAEHAHEHHHHHHEHDEHCTCGCHDHEHDHEHEHDEHCTCGCHDHDHAHAHDEHREHDHHHHAEDVFTSFGAQTIHQTDIETLKKCLVALDSGDYGVILRAKGILPAEDGTWLHFDYVPDEHDVRTGCADYTGRFCVIGTKLNEPALRTLFAV